MNSELYAFIAAIICGVVAVILWNIAEAFRNTVKAKAVINGILDVLWWVAVCVVFCICMWQILSLRVRAFEFIGVALGAFLCSITLAKPIQYIFTLIFGIILKIFQFILKILLTPWAFLYKILLIDKCSKMRLKSRKVADNESPQEKSD